MIIPFSDTFTCGSSFTDGRDGKTYTSVQIGTQCWMKENLNVGTRINGSSNQTNNGVVEKYCFNNLESNCDVYGGLYQWNELMQYVSTQGVKGICPLDWHIPTDQEWCTMNESLDPTVNCNAIGWSGTDAGGKMKEAGLTHWVSPNTGATNSSGFTALPGGYMTGTGTFLSLGYNTNFWSSTKSWGIFSFRRYLYYVNNDVYRSDNDETYGFSVRCLKDN